ncbi:SDR family NAD(P)-dependent oxidoreductase [Dasania marina]|uniref:SDR family NAD(P)-dependent oxidoreductase n=1 Tax=Dasania marina TaxID=471499 RepID=UPI00036EFFE0|nr:SDR family oxidoreductase [Dasania marina]
MQNPLAMHDRVIMITGGGQGIGRALGEQLLAQDARVALVDINHDTLAQTRQEIVQTGIHANRIRTYCGDVSNVEFVTDTVAQIVSDFGDLYGLINNAGIIRAAMASEMSIDQWNQVINVNLTGSFVCLQAVGKYLIEKSKNGDTKPGSIVNISSDAGRRGTIGQINYGAAKSGVLGMTMCSAREWGKFNINVNSVCYGMVETSMTETIRQDKFRDKYLSQIPLGRFSSTEEVAPATCFLLTDAAAYITGQHLSIDGGFYISS